MRPDFRASMDWLHTWSGVILGGIMFVIFFMGTLSVFKDEIDQWMWPYARHIGPMPEVSLDQMYDAALAITGENPRRIVLFGPTDRAPIPSLLVRPENGGFTQYFLDPKTYDVTAELNSASASHFFYPMHYHLHMPSGIWIVGGVSMFMLMALFSGVVIHRKIFVDFFTFRRGKKLPRVSLDLHNLTSVIALPFHIMITLTGILIFGSLYLQPSLEGIFPEHSEPRSHVQQTTQGYYHLPEPSGQTNLRVSSLDAMRIRAERYWGGQPFKESNIDNPHDENGIVRMRAIGKTRVSDDRMPIYFEADTGQILSELSITAAGQAQMFIVGMHEIHFDHLALRWLYFIGGIAGCIMIATGYIYWLESRRLKHARNGGYGVPVVEAVTIWGVMGVLTATAAYFVANRLLPQGMWSSLGISRIYWEVIIFYVVWLTAIPHGALRKKKAWFDQVVILTILCFIAPILNWVTTGDHLLRTIATGQWALVCVDLMLFTCAAVAAYAAIRLQANWRHEVEKEVQRAARSANRDAAPLHSSEVIQHAGE